MKKGRGTVGACLGAVLLSASLTAPAPAAPASQETVDWLNATPYIDHGGNGHQGWFRTVTNEESFKGGGVNRTGTIGSLITENWGTPEEKRDGVSALQGLWLPKCEPVNAQTAVFSRTVYLPGIPYSLKGSVFGDVRDDRMKLPLKSIEILINGVQVLEYSKVAPKGDGEDEDVLAQVGPLPNEKTRTLVDLTAASASVLKYGENEITFRAVKGKTKKKAGFCLGDFIWSIAGEVFAEFRADTSATFSGSYKPSLGMALAKLTVTNNGPSHNPLPEKVTVSATSEQVNILQVRFSTDNPSECSSGSSPTGSGYVASCPLPVLAPGETKVFDFSVDWTHREGNYQITLVRPRTRIRCERGQQQPLRVPLQPRVIGLYRLLLAVNA